MVALVAAFIGSLFGKMTVEDILRYTPENLLLAALVFMAVYTVKSLSVFFPLIVLYVGAGMVFSVPVAVAVNLCGLFICVSVPYWMGRLAGKEWVDSLLIKYKKARELEKILSENEWFLSYILRVVNILPGDIVSMFLGAARACYQKYVAGSIAGLFPTMLAVTLMGNAITEPGSPQFLISLGITVSLSAVSLLLYRRLLIKNARRKIRQ